MSCNFKLIKVSYLLIFSIVVIILSLQVFNNRSKSEIEIGNVSFEVEVVSDEKSRRIGLSGREDICDLCGMVFVFPEKGKYSFWMKGMKFNLDIIWINENEIVYFEKNIPYDTKKSYSTPHDASMVLEVKGDTIDKLGWKLGDKVLLK